MTDIWSWLDLHLLTAWSCFSTVVLVSMAIKHNSVLLNLITVHPVIRFSYAWRVMIVGLKHKRQCILWGWCWMTWIWLVSKIECQRMGMDGREQRSLGKLWHFWESVNLHSAGVGHFLLPTINANFFLYKTWHEAWYMVFTVTKHWGGYCSFGALFMKFIFQHKRMK
jgi:hypothetical protein